jgi:hypothetical protein
VEPDHLFDAKMSGTEAAADSHAWEAVKENFQPLKQGRRARGLGNAAGGLRPASTAAAQADRE